MTRHTAALVAVMVTTEITAVTTPATTLVTVMTTTATTQVTTLAATIPRKLDSRCVESSSLRLIFWSTYHLPLFIGGARDGQGPLLDDLNQRYPPRNADYGNDNPENDEPQQSFKGFVHWADAPLGCGRLWTRVPERRPAKPRERTKAGTQRVSHGSSRTPSPPLWLLGALWVSGGGGWRHIWCVGVPQPSQRRTAAARC